MPDMHKVSDMNASNSDWTLLQKAVWNYGISALPILIYSQAMVIPKTKTKTMNGTNRSEAGRSRPKAQSCDMSQ